MVCIYQIKFVLLILDKCNLYRSSRSIDPFLEEFFFHHGYSRIPLYDAYTFTGQFTNARFGQDSIEHFFNKAGYLRYGDKFVNM